jgi:biotin carboxyl carrier protein
VNCEIEIAGNKRRLTIHQAEEPGQWQFQLDGQPESADAVLVEPGVLSLLLDGKSYRVLLDSRPEGNAVILGERRIPYVAVDPRSLRSRSGLESQDAGATSIAAPMPGRVVRVLVAPGDRVEAQQGVIVVEAMKMQNELKAPRSGVVAQMPVAAGATVQSGQVLVVLE